MGVPEYQVVYPPSGKLQWLPWFPYPGYDVDETDILSSGVVPFHGFSMYGRFVIVSYVTTSDP